MALDLYLQDANLFIRKSIKDIRKNKKEKKENAKIICMTILGL